jgi:hypothetical protein
MRYRCRAVLCAAVAAALFCNINSEVVLAAIPKMSDLAPLPEFVPQARLTQFLLAVRETTVVLRTARQAAEELSAKFADNSPKQEVGDRFIRWEAEAAIEDPKPPIFVAAISDVVLFDVLDPKGRGKSAKRRAAAAAHTKAVRQSMHAIARQKRIIALADNQQRVPTTRRRLISYRPSDPGSTNWIKIWY